MLEALVPNIADRESIRRGTPPSDFNSAFNSQEELENAIEALNKDPNTVGFSPPTLCMSRPDTCLTVSTRAVTNPFIPLTGRLLPHTRALAPVVPPERHSVWPPRRRQHQRNPPKPLRRNQSARSCPSTTTSPPTTSPSRHVRHLVQSSTRHFRDQGQRLRCRQIWSRWSGAEEAIGWVWGRDQV